MRHAGALRIDHAMALRRLYWIPAGSAPTEGTYVVYPLEDLVGILALESHRHRCMVIGEDLGTVPPGFRERMAEANVLSYRVLAFEREDSGTFIPPERYPELSVAVFGNHDLPTLRGWWDAHDLELQAELEGTSPEDLAPRRTSRARDKQALLEALRSAQLLPQDSGEPSPRELVAAVHAFLGRTCALLALAQLDDVALERKPVNVPSLQQYPNWRRRLTLPLEELADDPILHGVAAAFAAAGRGPADRA
jgi:4-alpha-glucanotransferase